MSDFGYIVVGNFKSLYDDTLDRRFNQASGLTNFSFFVLMKTFASDNNISAVYQSDDSIVFRGTEDHLKKLKRENGYRFSYAFADQDGFNSFIEAEVNAQEYFDLHGTYEAGNVLRQAADCLDA